MADCKTVDPAPVPEKKWQTEQKWIKQDYYRGSQYPPFSIEPVPYERQRLGGAGMSAEDRALRKQWVKDQQLSPNEPRYVKELTPRNVFRRLYMGPADTIFSKLIPVIGRAPASMCRVAVPRMLLLLSAGYWAWYQLKYHPNVEKILCPICEKCNIPAVSPRIHLTCDTIKVSVEFQSNPVTQDWTRSGGFHIFRNKPVILSEEKVTTQKKHDEYNDKGFKARKVLLDGKTSGQVASPKVDLV